MKGYDPNFKLEPEEELIDDAFVVRETRFGLHTSICKDGRLMLTGLKREGVISSTRKHLQYEQEGWPEGSVTIGNNAIVGGKL